MFNEGCEWTDILSEIEVELYGFPEVVLNQKSFVRVSTNLIQLLKSPFCHFTWSFSSPISAQNHWIAIANMRLCSQVSDGYKPWGSWGIKLNNSNQALHPNRLHSDSKPSWPFEAITVVGVRSDVCLFFFCLVVWQGYKDYKGSAEMRRKTTIFDIKQLFNIQSVQLLWVIIFFFFRA